MTRKFDKYAPEGLKEVKNKAKNSGNVLTFFDRSEQLAEKCQDIMQKEDVATQYMALKILINGIEHDKPEIKRRSSEMDRMINKAYEFGK